MKYLLLILVLFSCKKEIPVATPIPAPVVYKDTSTIAITKDTSTAVFLIEFNGYKVTSSTWNNGNSINCMPSGLNTAGMQLVLAKVAADYKRYKVIVTTNQAVYNAAHTAKRMRCIVTPTSSWYSSSGGIAYTGSLTWGDETPCFVFSDRYSYIAKAIGSMCSHEIGHTVGLSHQAKYDASCKLIEVYNTGDTENAPIMGNPTYASSGGTWWVGPTPNGCGNVQNDDRVLSAKLLLK